MMKKLFRVALALVLTVSVLASLIQPEVKAESKMQVTTTFYPVYFLASEIAGDHAEVNMLIQGGQDAHDYEASAKDVAMIQNSDLFIYQDDEMEHFVPAVLNSLDSDHVKVIKATEGLELLRGDDHDHDHDHEDDHDHHHEYDPHTWLDPIFYSQQAENVANALSKADPDNETEYMARKEELVKRLEELHQKFESELERRQDRTFVVQHAAFGYLAHAYNLEQEAITGIFTTQEPSAASIAKVQDFVKEHNIKTIYVEPTLNDATAKTVADATGAQLLPLRTLESLSKEDEEAGKDYFDLMEENLQSLMNN